MVIHDYRYFILFIYCLAFNLYSVSYKYNDVQYLF